MRSLLLFFPLIGLPLLWLQFFPQQKPLPKAQKHDLVASQITSLQLQKPVLEKSPPRVVPEKLPAPIPKKVQEPKAKSQKPSEQIKATPQPKNRAKSHPYTILAIEIRVKVAQGINGIAIAQARSQSFASSTEAFVLDANEQIIEQLPANESFQVGTINSNILFGDWQIPSAMWIEPKEVRSSLPIAGIEASCY